MLDTRNHLWPLGSRFGLFAALNLLLVLMIAVPGAGQLESSSGTASDDTPSSDTQSLATGSLATGSLATGSLATGSLATGSLATGVWIVSLEGAPSEESESLFARASLASELTRTERRAALGELVTPARAAQQQLEVRWSRLADDVGITSRPLFTYALGSASIAVALSDIEAEQIQRHPEVRSLRRELLLRPTTDNGPAWIGAPSVWDGSNGLTETRGEGIVIGIVDSGIHMPHPSFSDSPSDGHTYTNPLGPGASVGWCNPGHPDYDPTYVCNDKLIGAWDWMDTYCASQPICNEADGPFDNDGHGTHVASIAAGNHITQPPLSGVAPHAAIISYDVCTLNDAFQAICPESVVLAGLQQALLDGVDVVNLSIQGGFDPWNDDDDALLDLVAAGTFVAASGGNNGATASTVEHRGPWVTTVAASSHDRERYFGELTGLSGGVSPPTDLAGASLTDAAVGPASIVLAADFGDPNCSSPFAPGTWSGEIVACEFLASPMSVKSQNVDAGGADGIVILSPFPTVETAYPATIPSLWLATAESDELRTWLQRGSGHTATLSVGSRIDDPALADRIRNFSGRGPNPNFDVIKPDLSAPGWSILAADADRFQTGFLGLLLNYRSGTSMSSPHVAGAAALIKSLHPGWTPSEIKSAMMTTAQTNLLLENGVTPAGYDETGSGRLDVERSVNAALVLDETGARYQAANPSLGGDPRTLNLPSMMHRACDAACTWARTVTNVSGETMTWTASTSAPPGLSISISPSTFELTAGSDALLDVAAYVSDASLLSGFAEAELILEPSDMTRPSTRLPILLQALADEPTTDLVISVTNERTTLRPGQGVSYLVTVTNNGPTAAVAPQLSDVAPPELSALSWTCSSVSTARCGAAAGSGELDDHPFLPAGTELNYVVTATVSAGASGDVTYTVDIATPPGLTEATPIDNTASDTDEASQSLVHADGFESGLSRWTVASS